MAKKSKLYKNIPVYPDTYEDLSHLGRKDETWDDIVRRLLVGDRGKKR